MGVSILQRMTPRTRLILCMLSVLGAEVRAGQEPGAAPIQNINAGDTSSFAGWIASSSLADEISETQVAGPVSICQQPDQNCQSFSTSNARQSNSVRFTSADDFTPAVSGQITDICWWGAYQPIPGPFPDAFTITYFGDSGGVPGSIIGGPFVQSSGTLVVSGPVDTGELILNIAPIWAHTATHAPVPVTAGDCYWIEIKNDTTSGANWFWEDGNNGNGSNLDDGDGIVGPNGYDRTEFEPDDRAWCVSVQLGDPNDCLPPGACCLADGSCNPVNILDCAAIDGEYRGPLSSCALENCPVIPPNDDCADAILIGNLPFSDVVDTAGASADGPAGSCDAFGASVVMQNDVWYEWTADRDCDLRVRSTPIEVYDTIIAVRSACSSGLELACADNNGIGVNEDAVESLVIPVTTEVTYLFQIGDNGAVRGGDPTLVEIDCLVPVGACCVDDSCNVLTLEDCASNGGAYLGDATTCSIAPLGQPILMTSNVNRPIPDGLPGPPGGFGAPVIDTIAVVDDFVVGDVNVRVQISHPFLTDLFVTLSHNAGPPVTLMANACGGNDDMNVTFDDQGDNVTCASPTVGAFRPLSLGGESLSGFHGQSSLGNWTLSVYDDFDGDIGTLVDWSLELDAPGQAPCESICTNGTIPADTGDGDVDLEDFAAFQRCMGDSSQTDCLCAFDANTDGVVDTADFWTFAQLHGGPDAQPSCLGFEQRTLGDFDGNGSIDLHDFAGFQRCFASTDPACICTFDANLDRVVGLDDFGPIFVNIR